MGCPAFLAVHPCNVAEHGSILPPSRRRLCRATAATCFLETHASRSVEQPCGQCKGLHYPAAV
eukprot:1291751-Pyramimonas_sp.AAC.1